MLAGGGSSRFGAVKQLVESRGEPLVRRAARSAVAAGCDPVFVVLGADADIVSPALAGIDSVRTLTNTSWRTGLASSLAVGMRAALDSTECDGALVMLADQPFVDEKALRSLIAAFDGEKRIIASSYDDVIGVPALFGREFLEELTRLTGDSGAGRWLRAKAGEVTPVPLQQAAFDVDTPSDAARLE